MSCYSLDFRKLVINFLDKGNSIKEAAILFNIAIRTIFNWKRRNSIGELEPKDNLVRKSKKVNQTELEDYIKNNPEETLYSIANHFNVHINAIFYRLKKANIVYKKKTFCMKKEMKN